MTVEQSPRREGSPNIVFDNRERRTIASYKRELTRHRRAESGLREALAREEALLGQKDELIKQQAVLRQEADRIATIGRIHRRLHAFDGVQTFALKHYVEDLCRDFSTMLSAERPERAIGVEGIEIELPAATAIPLGFIASELITNAAKHGAGRITVTL